jgi:lipopolysaccharide/colanic/teichoic acid biosynthesis glycosyltransferase
MKTPLLRPLWSHLPHPAGAPHTASPFVSTSISPRPRTADLRIRSTWVGGVAIVVGDALICGMAVVASTTLADRGATATALLPPPFAGPVGWQAWATALLVPMLLATCYLCGHYRQRPRPGVEALQLAAATAAVALAVNLLIAATAAQVLSLPGQLIWAVCLSALLLERWLLDLTWHRLTMGSAATAVAGGAVSAKSWAPGAASPGRVAKRTLDMAVAVLALLCLSPLLLAIALLVKTDGGPALFAHGRIGQHGRRFRCLKFRTMGVDAERRLQDLLAADPAAAAEWAATQKLTADPRVTDIGAVLRKTSLDELPQLLNVLRGEMSLVGPRPIVAAEVSRYGDSIACYYAVQPGVTGLWQVSGRSETTYAYRVQLDAAYVRNWSFWRDLAILLKTLPAVLARRGAV